MSLNVELQIHHELQICHELQIIENMTKNGVKRSTTDFSFNRKVIIYYDQKNIRKKRRFPRLRAQRKTLIECIYNKRFHTDRIPSNTTTVSITAP